MKNVKHVRTTKKKSAHAKAAKCPVRTEKLAPVALAAGLVLAGGLTAYAEESPNSASHTPPLYTKASRMMRRLRLQK